MSRFYSATYVISCFGAAVAAAALVFMVSLITLEITLRAVFSTSTFVMDEFVGYALSISIVWSLGYVLENNKLIRVNLLLPHLNSRMAELLTALSALLTCAATIALVTVFWTRAIRAYTRGTVSSSIAQVPTWIPETMMLVGLLLFSLQLAAYGLRHLTGHPSQAPAQAGLPYEE
ncbi:MAG: TRAP transporter small permease [Rhizobiaceae bacterium]|nr:TRAP transporter small permease subunit [Rhizobiaceae bacterium]MCO5069599.1 TRAP transporter small permease [Rhizobiaceae bacterium]